MVQDESQQKSQSFEKELVHSAKNVMSQNDARMYLLQHPLTKFAMPERSLNSLDSSHTQKLASEGRKQPGYIKSLHIKCLRTPKTSMFNT